MSRGATIDGSRGFQPTVGLPSGVAPRQNANIVYVAMHDDGSQRTYTAAEFAKQFGWTNDPEKATLLKLDASK